MKQLSVRVKLTAWFTGILALTLVVAGIGVRLGIQDSIHDTVDKDLRLRLAEIEEHPSVTPAGSRVRIAANDGKWIYQSELAKQWGDQINAVSPPPKDGQTRTIIANGEPVRILTAPVSAGTIQIGAPLSEFNEMLDEFTWTALLSSPILLLLAASGGYWMSKRALEPVDSITRMANRIGVKDLSSRLPLRGVGDELDRLSGTLNDMFARLENAFERIACFTADASHELRTPIAVIRTTAELTRGKPRSQQEYEQALDRILTESVRTTALIEDLLMLARSDAGAGGIAWEPVNLAEAVRDAVSEIRILAEAGKLDMAAEISEEAVVNGDGSALHRLLLVLLDNAIKYTPPGGSVKVSMRVEASQALVIIKDNGIGISDEDLPYIFERFYRASKDRSRKQGGAGLGLSIAKSIAESHGGSIGVESAVGRGSTFFLRLPISSPHFQNRTSK